MDLFSPWMANRGSLGAFCSTLSPARHPFTFFFITRLQHQHQRDLHSIKCSINFIIMSKNRFVAIRYAEAGNQRAEKYAGLNYHIKRNKETTILYCVQTSSDTCAHSTAASKQEINLFYSRVLLSHRMQSPSFVKTHVIISLKGLVEYSVVQKLSLIPRQWGMKIKGEDQSLGWMFD